MQFSNPQLVISAATKNQWPESSLPEVVLLGRSNVGKSSFINTVVNRKNLAYVGKTPGKTRLLNFYNLDDLLMLVDAPGYGYAKRSNQELVDYSKIMNQYFKNRRQLILGILILDIRHLPTNADLEMLDYLIQNQIPFFVILNKADKLSYQQKLKAVNSIKKELPPAVEVITFSSLKKENKEVVLEKLETIIKEAYS